MGDCGCERQKKEENEGLALGLGLTLGWAGLRAIVAAIVGSD